MPNAMRRSHIFRLLLAGSGEAGKDFGESFTSSRANTAVVPFS
jgi:hypothetical protein